MKNFINNVRADKLTYRGFISSFVLILLTIVFIVFYYRNLPPYLPLFNQLPWGNERLTQTPGIFIPVALYLFIFIFNFITTSVVYTKNPLIGRIIAGTTLLIGVMNFIFIIRTIMVTI